MARTLSSALSLALDDDLVYPFFAIDLMFTSGPLYLWTGLGTQIISGKTYTGTGNLMQVSAVQETADLEVKGATISLSGIPADLLSLALTEPYQGRVCRVYFGVTGTATEYTNLFTGYMDKMEISEGADSATITLSVESRLIDLERVRVRKYNHVDQKTRYPADKGLEYVERLQDKEIYWGNKPD